MNIQIEIRKITEVLSERLRTFFRLSSSKNSFNELKNAREFLDSIIENIPNMVFVKDARDLRFLRFNRAGEELLGIPAKELLGKNDYDFFPKEQADYFIEKDRSVLSEKKLLDIPEEVISTAFGPKKLHTKKIPINDEKGEPLYLLGISEDITAKQELLSSLKEAKERYDLCIAGSGVGLWDWNIRTNEMICSERFKAMLGREYESRFDFKSLTEQIHPEDKDRAIIALQLHLEKGIPYDTEYRCKVRAGQWHWFRAVGQAQWDEAGNAIRMAGTIDDITRLKEEQELIMAKDAAEAAATSKSMFLAAMSHEIRTPLTSIIGFGVSLKEDDLTEAQKEKALDAVVRNGQLLLSIVNDILDFSKLEAGQIKINHAQIKLFILIEELASNFSALAKEKRISFDIYYAFPIPEFIFTDGTRLRQVLYNLSSNAIKFTPVGGSIKIGVKYIEEVNQVEFSVVDTGIGISAVDQEKLFKPFSQANTAITREAGGTGLGLVISREIVNCLGGCLNLKSELHQGSTFYFTIDAGERSSNFLRNSLPAIKQKFHLSNAGKKENLKRKSNKLSGKILVVEDGEDNKSFIDHVLSRAGLDLKFCSNGKEGVQAALSDEFDVILMDVHMPVMDGLTATRYLRKHGYLAPIIALSASVMEEDVEKARKAGCTEVVGKPFLPQDLINILARFLIGDSNMQQSTETSNTQNMDIPTEADHGSLNQVKKLINKDISLKALTLGFMDRMPERVTDLYEVSNAKDFEKLRLHAHSLKGASAGYGFLELSIAAAELEKAAKAKDTEMACDQLQKLKSVIDAIVSHRSEIEEIGNLILIP